MKCKDCKYWGTGTPPSFPKFVCGFNHKVMPGRGNIYCGGESECFVRPKLESLLLQLSSAKNQNETHKCTDGSNNKGNIEGAVKV
jgi:hypothetical protein